MVVGMDSKKWAPIFTPTIFGGFLRHLMSSWQICCRQCDARGEVIEDQTLESAHSSLVDIPFNSQIMRIESMDGVMVRCINGQRDGWMD